MAASDAKLMEKTVFSFDDAHTSIKRATEHNKTHKMSLNVCVCEHNVMHNQCQKNFWKKR